MNTSKEEIYPLCYKIKESCPSCDESTCPSCNNTDCLKELSKYSNDIRPYKGNVELSEEYYHLLICLKKYGDIYKKLDIVLHVNEKKEITFPTNLQIQSSLNLYLYSNKFLNPTTPKEVKEQDEKIMLFNILLNDKLRAAYNRFYKIPGFADTDSLIESKYGFDKLINTTSRDNPEENVKEYDNIGGKKIKKSGKSKKTRTRKPRKTKKNRKTKSKKNKNLK